ncbi:putative L,D-transpeptidase YkuD [bioreactor metagenome]|uniref:Putative L,D-transpeptidase YkuD n=1 Tax=bioreactor metagenome TaxID=1076179 RepID=A0A644T0M5_9ZZZZ|nr:L,D-transpeptidase [Negativicutes bacterium]
MAYSIVIDLSDRYLYLFENGIVVKSYPVGVGKLSTPTPAGDYYIANKRPNPGGAFGVMWLGLSLPLHGIHGTNNPASIGNYVSKGCIRMQNHSVLELAKLVPVGTRVKIIY